MSNFEGPRYFAAAKRPKAKETDDEIILPAGPFKNPTVVKRDSLKTDPKADPRIAGFGDPGKLGH